LTFSHWKGQRAYVRERVTPKNPKAAKQTGVRVMWAYASKLWASIKVAKGASWLTLANADSISGFNAFVRAALKDWQNFLFPRQSSTDARTSTGLTVTTQTATGGVGCATLQITPSGATAIAGIAIFRGATGFTPSWANCVGIVAASTASPITFVDSPLAAGSYYYRTVVFNNDGQMGTIHAESTAVTVT
jgi:hypothetical protein